MKEKSESGFEAQWERFRQASGLAEVGDSADFSYLKQDSLAKVLKERRIPDEWLISLLRVRGINPDWILFGHSPRLLKTETSESFYPDGHAERELREACELLSRLPARLLAEELLRRIGSCGQ